MRELDICNDNKNYKWCTLPKILEENLRILYSVMRGGFTLKTEF